MRTAPMMIAAVLLSIIVILPAQELEFEAADYGMSSMAFKYVMEALGVMREHSYRTNLFDWNIITGQMLERGRDAQTTADTYDAIRLERACLAIAQFLQATTE